MDEIGIFGLNISTIANLAVAAGTIGLAIGTYLSIRTNQREKERPIVLEFVNSHLKPLKYNILHDIWVIEGNEIYWQTNYPQDRRDSLVFPITPKRTFFLDVKKEILPRFLQKSISLQDLLLKWRINKISKKLQKRYDLNIIIGKNLKIITNDLTNKVLIQLLDSIFVTDQENYESFTLKQEVDSHTFKEFILVKYMIRSDKKATSIEEFEDQVKSLIIMSLFKTRNHEDSRLNKRNYPVSANDLGALVDKTDLILSKMENDSVIRLKENVENALKEIKTVDEDLLKDIELIQKNLKEKYLFTEQEMK
jgi:hypothetical protein